MTRPCSSPSVQALSAPTSLVGVCPETLEKTHINRQPQTALIVERSSTGSEASEASERAGASGTRDETTGDDDDGATSAEPAVRRRGKKSKKKGRDARRMDAAKRR